MYAFEGSSFRLDLDFGFLEDAVDDAEKGGCCLFEREMFRAIVKIAKAQRPVDAEALCSEKKSEDHGHVTAE